MRRVRLLAVAAVLAVVFASPAAALKAVHRYQTGPDVRAVQWLLKGNQLHRDGHIVGFQVVSYRYKVTGRYDLRTVRAVRNAKYKLGWPSAHLDGAHAGVRFEKILTGRARRPTAWRVTAGNREVAAAKHRYRLAHPPLGRKIRLLVNDANYLVAHRNLVGYSQSTRMQIVRLRIHLPPLNRFIFEDCSSSVTGLYWLAGLPDPNGLHYNGYGYTGTQSNHGRVIWRIGQPISRLRAGDLVFYGGGWPHHHVAMYVGNGRVFSHGGSSGPFNLSIFYRSDVVGAHRYVG